MLRLTLILFACCLTPLSNSVRADLIAFDDFNYSVGANLAGQDGGFGFSGAWYWASSNANYSIASDSLEFPPLATSGNRVAGAATPGNQNAWMRRDMPPSRTDPVGKNGSTLYFSALLRPTGVSVNDGYSVLSLVPAGQFGNVGQELAFGKPGSGNYAIQQLGGIGSVFSDVAPELNQTVLLVLKAEFNANGQANDTFTLFVNPTPGAVEPGGGAVKSDFNAGLINYLAIRSSGAFELDELRIGHTFSDVTAFSSIPEPSSLLLLGVVTGWLARRRSRRR